MKTLTLFALAALLTASGIAGARGARVESWPLVCLSAALAAGALVAIRCLLIN